MRFLIVLITIFVFNLSFDVQAQTDSYFEEFLKEKIPNKEIRKHLEKAKIKADNQEDYSGEFDAINSILEKQQLDNDLSKSDSDFGFGAEPFVTVDPNDANRVVVTYMVQTDTGLSMPVHTSQDGGQTWTESEFDSNAILQDNLGVAALGGGDPIVVFDHNGDLHMTWLYAYLEGFSFKLAMFYATSEDGGNTFIIPSNIEDHIIFSGNVLLNEFIDRQWMATDNSGGENSDNLYISALFFGGDLAPDGQIVIVKDITEDGFPAEAITVIDGTDNSVPQFGNIEVDANGNIHLSCILLNGTTQAGTVMYSRSTDGGVTFDNTEIASATTTLANGNAITRTVHSRENSASSITIGGNTIYLTWTDMANQTIKSYIATSSDGGTTWSTPYEYAQDIVTGENYHLMPNVSADGDRVSISWYVVDQISLQADYWNAQSLDGGVTFTNAQIISDGSTNFTGAASEGNTDFYGDYNTSYTLGCYTYTVWSDGNSGEPSVYLAKVNNCENSIAETTVLDGTFTLESLYPNPMHSTFNIEINSSKTDDVVVEIFNIRGEKVMYSKTHHVNEGENVISLSTEISSGNYLLKLTNSNQEFISRILTVVE